MPRFETLSVASIGRRGTFEIYLVRLNGFSPIAFCLEVDLGPRKCGGPRLLVGRLGAGGNGEHPTAKGLRSGLPGSDQNCSRGKIYSARSRCTFPLEHAREFIRHRTDDRCRRNGEDLCKHNVLGNVPTYGGCAPG
jgi:hypothetical protein